MRSLCLSSASDSLVVDHQLYGACVSVDGVCCYHFGKRFSATKLLNQAFVCVALV